MKRATVVLLLVSACLFPALVVQAGELEQQVFLQRHWPGAIAAQGHADVSLPAVEQSLKPSACGSCHALQFQDWQTALHSKSMGPGIAGQLVEMVHQNPGSATLCWSCHAPLAEQKQVIYSESKGWVDNPVFDPDLQQHGMMCAACHVRERSVYGPEPSYEMTGLIDGPHNGFTVDAAFSQSEFCKGCHQFNENDLSLNGKLIENTYNEWKESKYPAQGVQCQGCHMPGRRHLWRGIHDPETVRNGIDIDLILSQESYVKGEIVNATITITNSGVGHHFPTYLTPKVFVKGQLVSREGLPLKESRQEYVIGRESYDLEEEAYDTRIPAGQQIQIAYQYELPAEHLDLQIEIVVDPDHWYRRFYEYYLEGGGGGRGRELLQEALQDSSESIFSIYDKKFALDPGSGG